MLQLPFSFLGSALKQYERGNACYQPTTMKGSGAHLSQNFGAVQPGYVHTRATIAAFKASKPLSRPTYGRNPHAFRHGLIKIVAAASATEEKQADKATATAPAQRQPANTVPKEKTILLQGDLQELGNCCQFLFVSRYRSGGNSLSERLPTYLPSNPLQALAGAVTRQEAGTRS